MLQLPQSDKTLVEDSEFLVHLDRTKSWVVVSQAAKLAVLTATLHPQLPPPPHLPPSYSNPTGEQHATRMMEVGLISIPIKPKRAIRIRGPNSRGIVIKTKRRTRLLQGVRME